MLVHQVCSLLVHQVCSMLVHQVCSMLVHAHLLLMSRSTGWVDRGRLRQCERLRATYVGML